MPVETVFSTASVKEPAAARRRPAEAGASAGGEGFSLPETAEAVASVQEPDIATAGDSKPAAPTRHEVAAAAARVKGKAADPAKPAVADTTARSQPRPVQPDAFIGTLTELLAAAQAQSTPSEGAGKDKAAGLEEAGGKDADGKKVAGKDKEKGASDTATVATEKSSDGKAASDMAAAAILPDQKPAPQSVPQAVPLPVVVMPPPSEPGAPAADGVAADTVQAPSAKKGSSISVAVAPTAKEAAQAGIPIATRSGEGEPSATAAAKPEAAPTQAGTRQAVPDVTSLLAGQAGKTGQTGKKPGDGAAVAVAGAAAATVPADPKMHAASKADAVPVVASARRAPTDAADPKPADPKSADPKPTESQSTDPASQPSDPATQQQIAQQQPAAQDAQQAVQQALAPIDLAALVQQAVGKAEPARLLSPLDPAAAVPNPALPAGQGPLVLPATPLHVVPIEIGLRALAGTKQFDIRLDPEELGRVDVNLSISDKGEVSARLVVDRVETLHLLQRDARTLERAFEQAGLKPSDGGVDISLRDPSDQSAFRQHRQQEEAPQRQRQPSRAETGGDDAVLPASPVPQRRLVRLGGVDLSI